MPRPPDSSLLSFLRLRPPFALTGLEEAGCAGSTLAGGLATAVGVPAATAIAAAGAAGVAAAAPKAIPVGLAAAASMPAAPVVEGRPAPPMLCTGCSAAGGPWTASAVACAGVTAAPCTLPSCRR